MNKLKTVKFLWISMWITLILMVILKLIFNYYYPIIIENSKLLSISKYIDDHQIINYIISYILYCGNTILITLCCLNEKWYLRTWHLILILGTATLGYIGKIINTYIGTIIILIPYIIIPLFITKRNRIWIFITFILDNVFQLLSNFVRGNTLIINDTFLIERIMLIDYYLMFIIYYIGGCHMGLATLLPWFTKKETVINAKIEKLQNKIKKLEAKKQCLKKQ